jgi:hypothetical protein
MNRSLLAARVILLLALIAGVVHAEPGSATNAAPADLRLTSLCLAAR